MRIIAGEARGRVLVAPKGRTTRPILDQLKQRAFDILGPLPPGTVAWDLFAGAGSLGLEALSRGAEKALFVDMDRSACDAVKTNLEKLGWEARGRVARGDAFRADSLTRGDEKNPGLIFFDPPFPLVERDPRGIGDHLDRLFFELLAPEGALVFRVPAAVRFDSPPKTFAQTDMRDHGVNVLGIARR